MEVIVQKRKMIHVLTTLTYTCTDDARSLITAVTLTTRVTSCFVKWIWTSLYIYITAMPSNRLL